VEVTVLNRQRTHPVARRDLVGFLQRLARELPARSADSVALNLVSARSMRAYNRTFRGQDVPTDVLAFPAGDDGPRIAERHLGDILVCVATAARQAEALGHSLGRELKILALHGYLHLLGFDHERDDGAMMRLQRRLVRRLLDAPARSRRP
jgi:probable rRNA maturation factor